ncbi:MAG: BrnT family toxin [Chitinispirillaceae bacterium]|nr:BrnT family toxin [Chitinispirillaceae bacterium]
MFYDKFAREFDDPDHSQKEYRFILLGISRNLRVLIVVFCHRDNENKIRIISARKANKEESQYYFRKESK